jgi:hypothetical protein
MFLVGFSWKSEKTPERMPPRRCACNAINCFAQAATGSPLLEHFSFCYRLPCPIHSAFFCGMGGIPKRFRSTQFPKML